MSNFIIRDDRGVLKAQVDARVMADDDVEKYMTILGSNEMYETWNASLKQVSYVAWLENRVRLLEEQINSVDHLTQSYDNPPNN